MRKVLLASVGLLFTTMVMNASQIEFGSIASDNTAFNTSLSFGPVAGVSVTATPYTDFGAGFVTGATSSTIQDYSNHHGLGICNSGEGCVLPDHQVDNVAGFDFILLHFSSAITLQDVLLMNVGSCNGTCTTADMDVTYYTRNNLAAVSILGATAGGAIAGFSGPTNDDTASALAKDTLYTRLSGSVVITDLLIGTRVGGDATPDYFKLDAVDFNSASVPEPATFVLMGSALLGLAGFRLRRKG